MRLDEIPQIWNVLKGEMSIVGPRPERPEFIELLESVPFWTRRHLVKPGITGWAQVNGRNALTWDEKFELDLWYVDHWTFLLDLKILCRTLGQVAQRTGVETMPEFMGPQDTGSSSSSACSGDE